MNSCPVEAIGRLRGPVVGPFMTPGRFAAVSTIPLIRRISALLGYSLGGSRKRLDPGWIWIDGLGCAKARRGDRCCRLQ